MAAVVTSAGPTPVDQPLIEPLSERELDVLRLLASDLGGPDIARELVVSLNTVRTHTKSIYAKLGVNSRRAAVGRAAELGLLARARIGAPPPDSRTRPPRITTRLTTSGDARSPRPLPPWGQ